MLAVSLQRDVAAVAVGIDQLAIMEQVLEPVGKSLDLEDLGACDRAARADDGVARADDNFGPAVDRARTLLELPDEAIVHAAKLRFLASLRSRSEKKRHSAIDTSRTSGCSILLNHPMKCVSRRRGMRLVSRKLMSSCSNSRRIWDRAVIEP